MKKIFLFFLMLYYCAVAYSQVSMEKIKMPIDTLLEGRFNIIIFNDFTWEYQNHDSVISLLYYEDSLKTYNYILSTKLLIEDSISIFSSNWDNSKILAYGDMSYKFALDTVLIQLTNNNEFCMPVKNSINSRFGWRNGRLHQGIDLKLSSGDTVVSAFDGIVRYTGYNSGYGNIVIIRHYNGLETFYSHLSAIKCKNNDIVKAGELLGLGGRTGRATGPHLHFEIRYKSNPINPESVIDFESGQLINNMLCLMPENFTYVKEICEAQYHTIISGDSLYSISKRYRTSIKALCSLNDISENSILKIGNSLRVR